MDDLFFEIEQNALYRKNLITLQASNILGTCETKADVEYLLAMIEAFLNIDNFLMLDDALLNKMLLLMNLINVKSEYSLFSEETSSITKQVEEMLKEKGLNFDKANYGLTHFGKYCYPSKITLTHLEILSNLSNHYEAIQTIKKLAIPIDYIFDFSFLEVMNLSIMYYEMNKKSYELNDYYLDCIDLFKESLKEEKAPAFYKKYLSITKRNLKRR